MSILIKNDKFLYDNPHILNAMLYGMKNSQNKNFYPEFLARLNLCNKYSEFVFYISNTVKSFNFRGT